MLEVVAVFLTIGAMLYRIFHLDIGIVVIVGSVCMLGSVMVFRTRRGMLAGAVCGGVLVLGALSMWRTDVVVDPRIYGTRAFDARVVSVNRQLDKTSLVVFDDVFGVRVQASVRGKVDVLPGDELTVRGDVEPAKDFLTDNGRIFGYEAYLKSKGVVGLVQSAVLGPVTGHSFSLARVPTIIRYKFADVFARYVAFPFDGVLAGMTVGYQGGLPDYIADLFRNTGVLHVLVLSGYNITLLASCMAILLKGLPFRVRTLVTIVAILMLVLVSGIGVASVRAGIMGSIAMVAGLSIRTYQPMRALVVAYLLFFFSSPTSIFVDPGFHLSFLATMFMILVLPKIERLFMWIPSTKHIDLRELIMLAVSAPIFMLPYMMYFSGNFPLSSPFANILFAIVTPFIMIGGIALFALSWVHPVASIVGTLISWSGNLILTFLAWCSHIYIWNTPPIPWWCVSLVYIGALYALFKKEITAHLVQMYTIFRRQTS